MRTVVAVVGLVTCFGLGALSPLPAAAKAAKAPAVVPLPVRLTAGNGVFLLDGATRIVAEGDALTAVAETIAQMLRVPTGFPFKVFPTGPVAIEGPGRNVIVLSVDPAIGNPEAYSLRVTPLRVTIVGGSARGVYSGAQTLRQLGPVQMFSPTLASGVKWRVPAVTVDDAPRFAYRGMHLDVGRHFFTVEFIKKYIDILAAHKLNTFHWHLTDDQGWRIEIKKHPRLTEVGGFRMGTQVGIGSDGLPLVEPRPYGGFYTQEQVREIVRHAESRFVTIIPEIEMPGHSQAALAAYPELACTPGPFDVQKTWGVFEDVFCPTEKTFAFLEDVLDEVVALFPGPIVHLGGDEVPPARWKASAEAQAVMKREGLKDEHALEGYFMKRMAAVLARRGRRMAGWDEIVTAGLPSPDALVLSWRGFEGGIAAAKAGHQVVMTPELFTYFDFYQGESGGDEPPARPSKTSVEKVYSFDPVPEGLTPAEAARIVGTQGCLWTEWVRTSRHAEYQLLPRMIALAEVAWSPRAARSWEGFARRLAPHLDRLDLLPARYGRQFFRVRHEHEVDATGRFRVRLLGNTDDPVHYTLDGTTPDGRSPVYKAPLVLKTAATVSAVSLRAGKPLYAPSVRHYSVNLAVGRPVQYKSPYSAKYPGAREHALTTGLRGGTSYTDGWQGFEASDLEAAVDLGGVKTVRRIEMGFLRLQTSWIMLPRSVEFFASEDGQTFRSLQKVAVREDDRAPEPFIKNVVAEFPPTAARWVRVHAANYGPLPDWHPGKGNTPWVFADQLIVD
jgi:hexosaminidase